MVSIGIAAILSIMVLEVPIIPLAITVDTHLKNPEIVPQITTAENEDLLKKRQGGKNFNPQKFREIFRENISFVKSIANFVFFMK